MTPEQTIMALTLLSCVLGILLLHSLWRRYALGSLVRAMGKEMKRFKG